MVSSLDSVHTYLLMVWWLFVLKTSDKELMNDWSIKSIETFKDFSTNFQLSKNRLKTNQIFIQIWQQKKTSMENDQARQIFIKTLHKVPYKLLMWNLYFTDLKNIMPHVQLCNSPMLQWNTQTITKNAEKNLKYNKMFTSFSYYLN